MATLKYWIWLSQCKGLSHVEKLKLLTHFHSPEDIYFADEAELRMVEGLENHSLKGLTDKRLDEAQKILDDCAKKELFVLTMADAAYPDRLRNMYDAPLLLYGKGAMPLFDEEATVSVVGTRDSTPYGIKCAEQLGYGLAKEGAIVVSGLAKGIDAAAHRGALRAGGFTAAVLGCGVDVAYPAENQRLYEDIAAAGVLLSEYPPQTPPDGKHFPVRNRIISGLSVATVVVEAPERSGALITANMALEQGREVFAVPGPIDSDSSVGCNRLIRDGAGLVSCAWDILSEYQNQFPHRLRKEEETLPHAPAPTGEAEEPAKAVVTVPQLNQAQRSYLTDDQIKVLKTLDVEKPMLMDDLAELSQIPIRRILSAVTMMEIDGFVRRVDANSFVRTVEYGNEER